MLLLEALPPGTTRGTLVRLIEQVGGLPRRSIGRIELRGRVALIEVPAGQLAQLVQRLDGTQLGDQFIRARSDLGQAGGGMGDAGSLASGWLAVAAESVEDAHFRQLDAWLRLEAAAEAAQLLEVHRRLSPAEAEQRGTSLVALRLDDRSEGLGGRAIWRFCKPGGQPLPWTRLGVGTPILATWEGVGGQVGARPAPRSLPGLRGVVSDRFSHHLEVAFERPPELDDPTTASWRLDLAGDESARARQHAALERAKLARGDRLAHWRELLVRAEGASFEPPASIRPLHSKLNEPQRAAVEFALAARDVAIIHGPPGTGKTTTVVELIAQSVAQGRSVLATAPSNLAVDNLLERLLAAGLAPIRVGHPARVLPALREHTLDLLVDRHPDVVLARRLVSQAQALRDKAARRRRAKPQPGARREMYAEARELTADARRIEAQVTHQILDAATVLCGTLTGLDSELLGQRRFDLVVIDEACQSTEPACWIPLLRAERLVLAGDHCQLPPTVVSAEALQQGFGRSLLERLIHRQPGWARRLEVQYRMHRDIMRFSSDQFYEGALVADPAVAGHLLAELPGVSRDEWTARPLIFIDTAGAGCDEELEPDGDSRRNPREGAVVVGQVARWLERGVPAEAVGVITPYAAQVRWLRKQLEEPLAGGLEVDTVDGFQGREKEAIAISLVRSNPQGELGFLKDVRRINVALTRARRQLVVIGDSATLGDHPFYAQLLEFFERQNAYTSIWELDDFRDSAP